MADKYPLAWPDAWPRTKKPKGSQFKTSLAGALKNVQDSVRKFSDDSGHKVTEVLISSNVSLGEQSPKDPGVAVYFNWDGISTCIAVDRYQKVQDNLQAIHHVLEAERTKLRHGGLNLVRAAFRGYAALPPPSTKNRRDWWVVLGMPSGETPDNNEIRGCYQKLRSTHHPDKGGDPELFDEIQQAWKQACEERGIK